MLHVLIPAAGLGRRMKSYGPKALINLQGETLIERQIRLVREAFPRVKITVVAGFEAHRLREVLPKDVRLVLNPYYETTNVAYSVSIGLRTIPPTVPVLVVYGDLVFNLEALAAMGSGRSGVLIDSRQGVREEEVGVTMFDNKVTHFSFGLPVKWCHVALLQPNERSLFCAALAEKHRRRHFGYEALNEVIDRGGELWACQTKKLQLVEIDTSNDIAEAEKIFLPSH